MRNNSVLFALSIAAVASVVLALPTGHDGVAVCTKGLNRTGEGAQLNRTRRSLDGLFDCIANGFGSATTGVKTFTDSVYNAFNGVFNKNNLKSLTDGFSAFGRSIKEGFSGMFGNKGEKLKDGFKKIGNSVKDAWKGNGKGGSTGNGGNSGGGRNGGSGGNGGNQGGHNPPQTNDYPSGPQKDAPPPGSVPDQETT